MKNLVGLLTFQQLGMLKRNRLICLVVIPLVLLLSFLGSSRTVFAYDPVTIVQAPSAYIVPEYHIVDDTQTRVDFHATIYGTYSSFVWQYKYEDLDYWLTSTFNTLDIDARIGGSRDQITYRLCVYYDDEGVSNSIYSNSVVIYNSSSDNIPQYYWFEDWGTSLLGRFIQWFSLLLGFMLDNPIVFIFLIMWMIVAAIGTLCHVTGNKSYEKEQKENNYSS